MLALTDEDAIGISQHFGQLKALLLEGTHVGDGGAQAIAEHLRQLTSLDLSINQIGDAGARAIAEHLGQLTSLNLGHNQIGDAGVRAIAEHLRQLTSLDLVHNQIGDAGARAIAKHLRQLTSLNLGDNQIGDAGARAIAEHLRQLETLDLSDNKHVKTVTLPSSPRLTTLKIAKTDVQDLSPLSPLILSGQPVHWARWGEKGNGIYVKHCPLTHPSPEVIQQGPEAVLNFFREIEAQGTDRLFEAKLLLVGEGSAGKTSLLRRLFQPDLPLPDEDETTRGIDIHRHEFPIADGRQFRLNAWDFGGQQIYHATHQFFLTKRSLYVLVDDTRSDHKTVHDEGFRYWLEVVETLSEASPLLIFQNEKGGRSKQLDIAGIKGRFPNVQGVYRGNLEHPDAADELRRAVEHFALNLPHVGEDVPAKWVPIRQELETLAKSRPHITLDEYLAAYRTHLPLQDDDDRKKALHLSQYLHDLGVFLHFQHVPELRRTLFLQNQWVTDAVFRVLDDEDVKTSNRGRFTVADCDRLWSEAGYADKEVELRALMVRFELAYRLPDTAVDTWLVPQHLPPSRPDSLRDWARHGDLMLSYRYAFLPRGMVSRLIVRMHRFVRDPDLCWSDGALFERDGTQVLVETGTHGNEITLRARGLESQTLLAVLASDLDALNDSFPGLKDKVSKQVPCICPTCAQSPTPAMFPRQQLLERKQRGKLTIECREPPDYHDVSVMKLLEGMDLELWLDRAGYLKEAPEPTGDAEESTTATGTGKPRTVRIFLASSAELRDDRDAFDLYFRQLNDRLRNDGLYLEIVRWENFLDAMSDTRLQDEYNAAIRACDIFVSLFRTKTGKYTAEEFGVAWEQFKATGKPRIYTYFHATQVPTNADNRADLMSLWAFKDQLNELGHFPTEYDSIEGLKRHFRDQLDRLRDAGEM
ncbi:MAG: hypothetical protein H6980_07500 [Gammaproteobacteria bacterium]|nr:hypothetical protein [Gammaproteobacteria bacterium]